MKSEFITGNKFVDVTLVVPVLPNLMNRDDTGKPKTTMFGGCERLSPSGQFLKRAWRRASVNGKATHRSKYIPEMIIKQLETRGLPLSEAQQLCLTKLLWEKNKKIGKAEGLLFFSQSEIELLTDIFYKAFQGGKSPTSKDLETEIEQMYTNSDLVQRLVISLYGRMFAGANENLNPVPDGALQVCKALSTAKVCVATDYFTAIDDYRQESEDDDLASVGSSHIGERQFSPGCNLLIQFRIDLDLLKANAKATGDWTKDALSVIMDFMDVAIFRPLCGAAAQGTYAISSRPFYAVVAVPTKGALYDMAGAFSKGYRAHSIEEDIKTLKDYMVRAENAYREIEARAEFCLDESITDAHHDKESFLQAVETMVRNALQVVR